MVMCKIFSVNKFEESKVTSSEGMRDGCEVENIQFVIRSYDLV